MPFISSAGRRFAKTKQTVAPGPTPGTQLLLNSGFTDFNASTGAATSWSASPGWQAFSPSYSASRPCTVTNMPSYAGVYPTSSSTGFVIFSYVSATISQTINITSLTGINTITGVLNIANTNNRSLGDTFTFQIQYKNAAGTVLYTSTTNSTTAPAAWTDYTLTLTRASSPNFDLIKSATVNITGIDSGFWNGQFGPAMDYCTLTLT